jgi:hypothetical protein
VNWTGAVRFLNRYVVLHGLFDTWYIRAFPLNYLAALAPAELSFRTADGPRDILIPKPPFLLPY